MANKHTHIVLGRKEVYLDAEGPQLFWTFFHDVTTPLLSTQCTPGLKGSCAPHPKITIAIKIASNQYIYTYIYATNTHHPLVCVNVASGSESAWSIIFTQFLVYIVDTPRSSQLVYYMHMIIASTQVK